MNPEEFNQLERRPDISNSNVVYPLNWNDTKTQNSRNEEEMIIPKFDQIRSDSKKKKESEKPVASIMDQIKKGVGKVFQLPQEGLNFLMDGGQKRKLAIMRNAFQKSRSTFSRMNDENFKKNHPLKYFILLIGFYLQYIVMPIIVLIGTILCILSLLLWNAYFVGQLPHDSYQFLRTMDLVLIISYISPKTIAVSFICELAYYFFNDAESLVEFIINFENILDILLIFQLFYSYGEGPRLRIFSIFNKQILRSLRVLKLRYLTKLVTHYIKKFILRLQTDDLSVEEADAVEERVLNKFIMDSIIKFLSGILIEATYYIVIDELTDFKGYNKSHLTYVQACYFTIVSFSTIGFGDIFPILAVTRIAQTIAIIVNFTFMSSFLGKLIDFLFQLSPYDRDYNFKDHVVIIGGIEEQQLNDLLHELSQNDLIYNEHNNAKGGIKTIIVKDDEPNETMRTMAIYFTDLQGNEVVFLKDSIFSQTKKWYKLANLKQAKILFAFSWFNDQISYEKDKLISLIATGVRETFPDLRVVLVLNSSFINQIQNDSLYVGIEAFSPYQLNDYIMASNLENPGLGTVLQHLVTMKMKSISKGLLEAFATDKTMLNYITNMQQEIYQFELPDFFIGMSFQECCEILYLYGLEFSATEILQGKFVQDHYQDDRKMTLIAVETSSQYDAQSQINIAKKELNIIREEEEEVSEEQDDDSDLRSKNNSQIQTPLKSDDAKSISSHSQSQQSQSKSESEESGIQQKILIFQDSLIQNFGGSDLNSPAKRHRQSILHQEEILSKNKKHILVNPQNCVLRKGDILYVICENYEIIREIYLINEKNAPEYIKYATNMIAMQKNLSSKKNIDKTIENMYQNCEKRYRSFKQENWQNNSSKDEQLQDIYDFEHETPGILFEDHFLIFGKLQKQAFITSSRLYVNTQIGQQFSIQKKKQIPLNGKKQNNFLRMLFLLKENFSINSIFSNSILLLSNLNSMQFSDAIGLCIARIITDHYERTDFIIELRDAGKIHFLNKNPKLKAVDCQSYFYPSFVSGNIHLSSMITAILARVVFAPNWLRFFQDLIMPKQPNEKIRQNKTVHFLQLSKEVIKQFSYYGQLHYAMLENKPSIIGIGLIKKQRTKSGDVSVNNFVKKQFLRDLIKFLKPQDDDDEESVSARQKEKILKQQIKELVKSILGKTLGDRYILTNPSFYTLLEETDGVIVLGDLLKFKTAKYRYSVAQTNPLQLFKPTLDLELEKILSKIETATSETGSNFSEKFYFNFISIFSIKKLKSYRGIYQAQDRYDLKERIIKELKRHHNIRLDLINEYKDLE